MLPPSALQSAQNKFKNHRKAIYRTTLNTLLKPLGFIHPNNRNLCRGIYLTRNKHFPRYPDYYHPTHAMVADAKYKRYIDTRDDINQMITYMYRLQSDLGIFLKPAEASLKADSKEDMSESITYPLEGYGGDIAIVPLHVPQGCSHYADFKGKMQYEEHNMVAHLAERLPADL